MHPAATDDENRGSKVRAPIAEFRGVTTLARSPLPPSSCADIRLARQACPESRIIALRTAIGGGSYRIDPEAIATGLIAALTSRIDCIDKPH